MYNDPFEEKMYNLEQEMASLKRLREDQFQKQEEQNQKQAEQRKRNEKGGRQPEQKEQAEKAEKIKVLQKEKEYWRIQIQQIDKDMIDARLKGYPLHEYLKEKHNYEDELKSVKNKLKEIDPGAFGPEKPATDLFSIIGIGMTGKKLSSEIV